MHEMDPTHSHEQPPLHDTNWKEFDRIAHPHDGDTLTRALAGYEEGLTNLLARTNLSREELKGAMTALKTTELGQVECALGLMREYGRSAEELYQKRMSVGEDDYHAIEPILQREREEAEVA